MASPITVGTTAIVAAPQRLTRAKIRFQNVGATTLYFKRITAPTTLDYEFVLAPGTVAELNEAYIETNSTSQFNVISSAVLGSLAIFETIYV